MSKVRNALKHSILSSYAGKVLGLLSVVTMSRLLSPEEIGTFAIAAASIMVLDSLKSFGMGGYLVRKEVLTEDNVRSALGVNITISWTLGCLIVLFATDIASYYELEDLSLVLYLLSASFFFSPFIGNGMSLLAREYKFQESLKINLLTISFDFALAVTLVICGFSYYSLGIATACSSLFQMCLVRLFQPSTMRWLPKFGNFAELAKIGVFVTLSNLLERFTVTCSDLIIGKMGNATDVAFYSRGIGFIEFLRGTISEGIKPVCMPYLAEEKRLGNSLEQAYNKANTLLGGIVMPVLLVASIANYPIILFFFGEQWVSSASLAGILSIWGLLTNIHGLSPILLITLGKENLLFYRNFIVFLLTAISIYFSYPYGLEMVAWSMVVVAAINFVGTTLILKFAFRFSIIHFIRSQMRNIFICVTCFVSVSLCSQLINFETSSIFISLPLIGIAAGVTWLASLVVCKHPLLNELLRMFGLAKYI